MSSAMVSQFYDVTDVLRQNFVFNPLKPHPTMERRNTVGAPPSVAAQPPRNRNFSIGNFTPVNTPQTCVISNMDNQMPGLVQDQRKYDRSYSEPCDRDRALNNTNLNVTQQQAQQNKQAVNSSRYKTELCRPFEESGHCKYADKCQFAHGQHELKALSRHPKYKTELCRTFHSKGFCPYGPRCNFVHNDDVVKRNDKNNQLTVQQQQQVLQPPATQYFQHISPPSLSQSPPPMVQRPNSINFNSSYNGSLGSTADSSTPSSVGSESPSLSPVFFGEDVQPHFLNSCYSLPPLNNSLNSTNNTVFNMASDFGSLDLSPLNIQTTTDLLTQQFNTLLNLNTLPSKLPEVDEWESSSLFGAPLSSPDSVSGDSIGSSSSLSSNTFSCGSPASESGKNFRLPVFNHISQD